MDNKERMKLKDELKKIFGSNMRVVREESGDSIPDAKEKTGISPNSIGNYENGKREMGIVDFYIFCKQYNIPYERILDYRQQLSPLVFDEIVKEILDEEKGGL